MGWISPIIIISKMFMQQLWHEKYSWDEPLPQNLTSLITNYFDSLGDIRQIKIPRWTGFSLECLDVELHEFSDA